jgi:hypothetical protein
MLLVCLILAATAVADGSFLGQVVKRPTADAGKNWVYIQGPHLSMRRVDISGAKIKFSSSIGKKEAKLEDVLREGAQVRVTASQDGQGEWKASEVEIVKAAPK